MWRRPLSLAGAIAVGIALGFAMDMVRVGGLDAWNAARAPHTMPIVPAYQALGRTFEIDGRAVYMDCRGSGSPTVILESGFAEGAAGWGATLDGIAGFTRVCAWDRPGLGRSEPRGVHDAADTAADLRAVLGLAGESGPYVVVAHSFGGVYARVFGEGAGSTGDVAAYLMLDTYTPDHGMGDDPTLPDDVREDFRVDLVQTGRNLAAGEDLDWPQVLEDLEVAGPADLPGIRLTIDPASRWSARDPGVLALLMDSWRRSVARVYPGLRHEIAEASGHVIQHDRPDLVVERTRELVDRLRAGTLSP